MRSWLHASGEPLREGGPRTGSRWPRPVGGPRRAQPQPRATSQRPATRCSTATIPLSTAYGIAHDAGKALSETPYHDPQPAERPPKRRCRSRCVGA